MKNKILVICTLKDELVTKYNEQINYLPLSNDEADKSWCDILQQYKPNNIVFGLQTIDEEKLSYWRQLKPNDALRFVRKGTSLHRVDFRAAEKYQIDILNIPGINASFVASFIVNLFSSKVVANTTVAVVGVGDIGKKVVDQLSETARHILLYNRTHYIFNNTHYRYCNDLLEIFSSAKQIAMCLPLTNETKGIITAAHIRALPENGQVVCISPPRIMSTDAIVALDERKDIHVTFDHVVSGLQFIHESLGHTQLRDNFIFEEKAAASYECQYAMGEAAIIAALS